MNNKKELQDEITYFNIVTNNEINKFHIKIKVYIVMIRTFIFISELRLEKITTYNKKKIKF